LILPDFLRHYRGAGINRFVFIDNNSTDGSREYLCEQPDVELYFTDRPFVWQRKHGWIFLAIMMAGRGRRTWFLYADADEHFVFDGIGRRSFADLARHMERAGISRVRGVLVDMYPEGPVAASRCEPGTALADSFPYFDGSGYVEAKYAQIISRKGGPRKRVFGHVDASFNPELTKYPLFQLHNNEVFANPHHIWPYEPNYRSPCYIGILHYKFLPGLMDKINHAIAAKSYWNGSSEYRCYLEALRADPALSLFDPGVSRRYTGPASLIEHGIIEPIAWAD
jgi:hypothetical protein